MLAALSVAAGAGGCRRERTTEPKRDPVNRLRLTGVDVVMAPGAAAVPGISSALVRGWVVTALQQAPHVALAAKTEQPERSRGDRHRLRIRVGRALDSQGAEIGMVSAIARRLDSLDGLAFQSAVAFDLERDTESRRKHLRKAVQQALSDLDFQADLALGAEEPLLAALRQTKDAHRLISAIDIAALRRPKRAVKPLVMLLKHEDDRVADRAVGALVAIGERSAVRPLTRLAKFEDTEKLAKLIDGIAALGGPEARSYLEFVAEGHPDPDIRDLAGEAIRRSGSASPASDGG